DVLSSIKKYRPTIFPGVPNMYVAINNFPGVRKYGIRSINACISGSAPLPVEVQEAFEKLTKGRLVEGYGLTEASPVTHANPLNGKRKVGSIGIPVPSTEAAVVDLKRRRKEVESGQIGELAIRGPQVMMGYWKDEKATSKAITKDGWLLTGDVAQMDSEGYFRIIARKADMWYPEKPGGLSQLKPAFPRDVEEVIYEIPQIKEVAVVAAPDPKRGEKVKAVVVLTEGMEATEDEIIDYCRERMANYKVPREVEFRDSLPKTRTGKIARGELAQKSS
ncbi:AMP-binding protein, partial [bacterium]|nr:AMP-binding protein [bacterium]